MRNNGREFVKVGGRRKKVSSNQVTRQPGDPQVWWNNGNSPLIVLLVYHRIKRVETGTYIWQGYRLFAWPGYTWQ
jgi:hypothetical protein